ncbi:MAG: bifunctional diaminohydroxyphosphoribosylaminopyrimidine deaminase/5-amino-6-(5-phosphoribosylamino)uracil reductase RibD [Pseudohongiellaceae bacterium]
MTQNQSLTDYTRHMARALELARSVLTTAPNPRVGCVIVRDDGSVAGEGWHSAAGEAHAEVNALREAGAAAKAATAVVTLVPCCHFGRTPPCCDALIDAGIRRVVYAATDAFPEVKQGSLPRLESAGIEVIQLTEFEATAEAINPGYHKRLREGRPFLRCKVAMSLDGRSAMADRSSKWITTTDARADVQRFRAASGAVITGINTVLADDPGLNVRPEELPLTEDERAANAHLFGRQPLRVILDSGFRTPPQARIVQLKGKVVIYGTQTPESSFPGNVDTVVIAGNTRDGGRDKGGVPLPDVLESLARNYDCTEVLLEAGPVLSGAFLRAGLVDELIVYVGAKLMGSDALPLFDLPGLRSMADCVPLEFTDVTPVGADLRITARPTRGFGNENSTD